jgi:hypothetical protein
MMIMIGISLLMPNPATARLFSIFGVFPLVVIIFAIIVWAPKWLKPEWEQWLEATHGDILELLIREARQTSGWASMVSTQEGLEDWVARTRRKYSAFATPRPDNYHLGDRVLWFSTSNHVVWPVQATVVKITEKRVQIGYEEGGETKVSYVPPNKLELKGAHELRALLFKS